MVIDNLIAELEAATEGSRELDHSIFLATHPEQGTTSEGGEYWYAGHLDEDGGPWIRLPKYTTSLDAALTLVPKGWSLFGLRQGDPTLSDSNPEKRSWASIKPHQQNDAGWKLGIQMNHALTPALALCIAIAKTRQAIEEN